MYLVDFDLRLTGLFYYVLASSENMSDALHRAERYSRIVNEGISLRCTTSSEVAITLSYVGVERRLDRHQIEFWLVSLVRLCRQLANRRLVPSRVRLAHHRSQTPAELRSLLGCEVEFGANVDEIVFPAAGQAAADRQRRQSSQRTSDHLLRGGPRAPGTTKHHLAIQR